MKKKTFRKLLSVCTIVAVALCFTVTPISQVITGDYDSGYAYAATKKTSSKSSSSKSSSSKSSSSKSSSSKSSSSKSSSSKTSGKNSNSQKSSSSSTKNNTTAKGAQNDPSVTDLLEKNPNKRPTDELVTHVPTGDELYHNGTNSKVDGEFASGCERAGYTGSFSQPPTTREMVLAVKWAKETFGSDNTYGSTYGSGLYDKVVNGTQSTEPASTPKRNYSGGGSYTPAPAPELPEPAPCTIIYAKITSTPKDGKAYFDNETLTYEVKYSCETPNNHENKNLLKQTEIGNLIYGASTPAVGTNTITYTGSISLKDLNAGTHTLEYISNENKKIGSDDFKVQKAGAVLPGGNGENEATGSGSKDYNLISHTKKWNQNRKDFNSKSSDDRAYNVFWIGEELISTLRYNMPEDADAALKAKIYATKAELRKDTKSGALMHTFALTAPSKVSGKDGYTHEQKVKLLEGLSDTAKKTLLNNIKSGTYWIVLKNAAGEEIASCKIVFDNTIEYYAFHRTTSGQTNNRLSSGNL